MLLVKIIIIFLFVSLVTSFNLDTNHPIIYLDPLKFTNVQLNKNSYFGYSVILYGGNQIEDSWIQIGAPRGVKKSKEYSGVVFRCGIQNICKLIVVDRDEDKNRILKNGAWIGGTMDISEKFDRIVVCGHRWIQINPGRNLDYLMRGACYWSHINENTTERLVPLSDNLKTIYHYKKLNIYYYGQGQAGISACFTNSKNHSELLLGAPGVYNWAGTSIIYRDNENQSPIASKLITRNKKNYNYEKNNFDEFGDVNIVDTITTPQTYIFDLFGYAVTSGYFFNKNELLYVTSAPKSRQYFGQIIIYNFANQSDKVLIVKDTKKGEQFGEYFGASITAGDINNDGFDDIVIGAPFHSNYKYNEGRIYVFFGSHKGSLETPVHGYIIDGKVANGQFGASLSFLSDLDRDGYSDIAVGAPNENDGSGVIYIFKGTSHGVNPIASQKIIGKDILSNIRGFGISISKPVDIDNNKYNDIAVGAYLSRHAILFRGKPTVVIRHSMQLYVNYEEGSFVVNICFYYDGLSLDSSLGIKRIIDLDSQFHRASLEDSNTVKLLTLHINKFNCENVTAVMKKNVTNFVEPVTVSLSHQLQENNETKEAVIIGKSVTGTDRFCLRCPIYDSYRSSKKKVLEIPFVLGCGNDNICHTKLIFKSKFLQTSNNNTFIMGSSDFLTLETTITNEAEKAYLTKLIIELPDAMNFRSIPLTCIEQSSTYIICNVDNPLTENKTKIISLDLDMKDINSGKFDQKNFNITIKILTNSKNLANDTQILQLKMVREADITISGKSGQQSYSYGNFSTSTEEKTGFTQIYQIEKVGASPIDEVEIEIKIPKSIKTSSGSINFLQLYQPEGYLSGQAMNCRSEISFILDDYNLANNMQIEDNVIKPLLITSSSNKTQIKKRSTETKKLQTEMNEFQLLSNRTFYINCSNNEVKCVNVYCTSGPFKKRLNNAVLQLKMLLDGSSLKGLLGNKNVIVLTTEGKVIIKSPEDFKQSGNRPDFTLVSSIFIGESKKAKIDLWIVIISVVIGLLLLLLLIMGLVKAGFFKRTTKMELEALKNAEVTEDFIRNSNREENTQVEVAVNSLYNIPLEQNIVF